MCASVTTAFQPAIVGRAAKLLQSPRFNPKHELNDHPQLTAAELAEIVDYIETHRAEFEAEYRGVLERAEAERRYGEERNRGRIEPVDSDQLSPERRALCEKLQAWKEQRKARVQGTD